MVSIQDCLPIPHVTFLKDMPIRMSLYAYPHISSFILCNVAVAALMLNKPYRPCGKRDVRAALRDICLPLSQGTSSVSCIYDYFATNCRNLPLCVRIIALYWSLRHFNYIYCVIFVVIVLSCRNKPRDKGYR